MKGVTTVVLVLAALAVCVVLASDIHPGRTTYSKLSEGEKIVLFKKWSFQNEKVYSSIDMKARFNTFKESLQRIDELNARNTTTQFGITKFADMSPSEFKKMYLGTKVVPDTKAPVAPLASTEKITALPTSWDWRTKGAVTPVKNQGQCGSCWAFSTTGNVEGQWKLAGNPLVGLSEQNLVDCDTVDEGCNGGLMANAFQYIMKNDGIDTEASYPYQGVTMQCAFNRSAVGAKISNYTMIAQDEDQMAAYMYEHGPISIAADAEEWQYYVGGVFAGPCGTTLDHGILIVGYDQEVDWFGYDIKYWWVKNSWGSDWGYSGYLKIQRGVGECGLNKYPCSSIINH